MTSVQFCQLFFIQKVIGRWHFRLTMAHTTKLLQKMEENENDLDLETNSMNISKQLPTKMSNLFHNSFLEPDSILIQFYFDRFFLLCPFYCTFLEAMAKINLNIYTITSNSMKTEGYYFFNTIQSQAICNKFLCGS